MKYKVPRPLVSESVVKLFTLLISFFTKIVMGNSRKNPNRGSRIYFSEPPPPTSPHPPLEFLDLPLYPKKFRRKQVFTLGNSAKLCDTPWKFQSQKPRPHGNST